MTPTVEAALFFHARGWVPVRVKVRGKNPIAGEGWQHLRPTRNEIGTWGDSNVGVLLGSASGHLVDIDLDCPEAMALAPFYLRPTWVFGRESKPRSHWLYICADATATRKFTDCEERAMLEFRSDASEGPGHQTVFPPSIHESGERIEWDPDLGDAMPGPLEISFTELGHAVANVARGCLFMRTEKCSLDEARAKVAAYRPPPRPPGRRTPAPRRGGDVIERARKYLAKMEPAISGQGGHLALFKAAVALVRGFQLDEEAALDILRTDYNPRCQPAWKERELRHKVRQVARRSTVASGYLIGEAK
jgi:hypothetical protein